MSNHKAAPNAKVLKLQQKYRLAHNGSGTASSSYGGRPPIVPGSGKALFPHGGARNLRGRLNLELTEAQCRAFIAAAQTALTLGLPLNRWITIHTEQAGVADADVTQFINRLMKLYREWVGSANAALLWVRENGDRKGSHVHILLHLPDDRTLVGRSARWIKAAAKNRTLPKRTILTRSVQDGLRYNANLKKVLGYALKGASAEILVKLGHSQEHQASGPVSGKRCGGTRNIYGASRMSSER